MKFIITISIAVGVIGLLLGHWLTLLVTNIGIYAPSVYTGKSVTADMAIVSSSFARGTGPGFSGLFAVPVLFLYAFIIKGRKQPSGAMKRKTVIWLITIAFFYGFSTYLICSIFSSYSIPNVPATNASNSLSGAGVVTILGLVTGLVAVIRACRRTPQ